MAGLTSQLPKGTKHNINWFYIFAIFYLMFSAAFARDIRPRGCVLESNNTSISTASSTDPSTSSAPLHSTSTSLSPAANVLESALESLASAISGLTLTTFVTSSASKAPALNSSGTTITVSPVPGTGTGTFTSTASNGVPFLVYGFVSANYTSLVSVLEVITTTCVPTTTVTAVGNSSVTTIFGQCGDGVGPQVTPAVTGLMDTAE